MGMDDASPRRTLNLLHHPTGTNTTRTPDWVVLAVAPNPVEGLYHELGATAISVERVGDCVAPRRAHAAVIEGARAGAAQVARSSVSDAHGVAANAPMQY
jgi:2,4-dienoyl-CoA reductase (NADPH2)